MQSQQPRPAAWPARISEQGQRRLSALDEQQREKFIEFGFGSHQAPAFSAIHQAFEHYACKQPEAIAVRDSDGRQISYVQLQAQAERLARLLRQSGVQRGDRVCLFVRRSIEMVVGIIASLKAGAIYVPQDMLLCPGEQREYIRQNVAAKVLLTTASYRQQFNGAKERVICIDQLPEPDNTHWQPVEVEPEDGAAMIFTSGTTGRPNGVLVSHGNLCNILLTAPGNLNIQPGWRVAQQLNIAFDMAVWEILGCLGNGASLLIRDRDFAATAAEAEVLIATPSILSKLDPAQCPNIKVVAVAGEPCPRPLAERWAKVCAFYNSCGPTETTIINTAARYYPGDQLLTIGGPTPNNSVYVLDENLNPCGIGEVGEMWAGGDCVTLGYWQNPMLSAERYKDDPFLIGRKMFRTRDLGRWTIDGRLEHLGRVDDQVKIRGFRVELDAVSSVLEQVEGCTQAAALKFDDRHLVAFVAPADVPLAAARERLAAKLPYYCEPLYLLALDVLPVTGRGKIDKRELLSQAQQHHLQQSSDWEQSA